MAAGDGEFGACESPNAGRYTLTVPLAFDRVLACVLPEARGLQETMASLSIPSWNQIAGFLEAMRQLRDSSGFAA